MVRQAVQQKTIQLADREIPLSIQRHPRARRISLRLDGTSGGVRLVMPKRMALRHGLDFAETKAGWIIKQIDSLPARIPFDAGAVVPLLGIDHVIQHEADARRGVWRDNGLIWVSGFIEHLPRRVTDFVKALALAELTTRAQTKAAVIGHKTKRVSLRDTTSRWGSCSADGRINFSWRLIFAPEEVLDYVVAHEVAHLEEMNHSDRFWKLTAELTGDLAGAQRWLTQNGDKLLRYG